MKRSKLIIAILLLFAGSLFSQSITVTAPAAGATWHKGSAYNITWTSSGCASPNVKINIFRNSIDVANFVEQLVGPNSGTYRWTVPATYSSGNYVLRVKTDPPETGCLGDSRVFIIADAPEAPVEDGTITVTAPTASSSWGRGTSKTITWTKTGTLDTHVKIHLMNEAGNAEIATVIASTPNDLSHNWSIPVSQSTGRYRIRVKTLDNRVSAMSPAFSIFSIPAATLPEQTLVQAPALRLPAGTRPIIRVVYPNGGEVLTRGSRVEIRWECVDGFNPPRIKIQKNGRTVREYGPTGLYAVPSGDGYIWPWFVPSDLEPGTDYKVRIEKGDYSRSNDLSDNPFTISGASNIEVTDPRGGGLVVTNGTFIRWRVGGVTSNVHVQLINTDRGSTIAAIRTNIPATPSSFLWYVGALEGSLSSRIFSGDHYKISVVAADGSAGGESPVFQIIKPTLEVLSPNGGTKERGDNLDIRWNNSPGFHGNVNVILERKSGSTFWQYEVLFSNTHDKTLTWRIPPRGGAEIDPIPTGTHYRIKIESVRCPKEVVAFGEEFYLRR